MGKNQWHLAQLDSKITFIHWLSLILVSVNSLPFCSHMNECTEHHSTFLLSAYCFIVVKVERLTIFAPPVFMWSQTKQIQSVFGSENSVEEHLCLWHWKADFSWFSFFIGLSGEPGCCVLILLQASPRTVFFELYFLYTAVKLYSLFISQCIFRQAPSGTALAALWRFTRVFPGSG